MTNERFEQLVEIGILVAHGENYIGNNALKLILNAVLPLYRYEVIEECKEALSGITGYDFDHPCEAVAVAKDTIRELKFKNVKHSIKSPMGTDMLLSCSGLLCGEIPKNLEFKVSQKRRPKP